MEKFLSFAKAFSTGRDDDDDDGYGRMVQLLSVVSLIRLRFSSFACHVTGDEDSQMSL